MPLDSFAPLRGFDPDLFLLEHGLRDLGRKEDVPAPRCAELEAWATERGLHTRIMPTGGPDAVSRGLGGTDRSFSVFLGRRADDVDAAVHWTRIEQARGHQERSRARQETGRLLGYPSCCVEAFVAQPEWTDEACLARLLASGSGRALEPLCNCLVPGTLVVHYPCTWECVATRARAQDGLRAAEQTSPALAAALRRALSSALLVVDRFRIAVLVALPEPDGSLCLTERYTFLDFCTDPAVQASVELRRYAAEVARLATHVPASGMAGATLLRFRRIDP